MEKFRFKRRNCFFREDFIPIYIFEKRMGFHLMSIIFRVSQSFFWLFQKKIIFVFFFKGKHQDIATLSTGMSPPVKKTTSFQWVLLICFCTSRLCHGSSEEVLLSAFHKKLPPKEKFLGSEIALSTKLHQSIDLSCPFARSISGAKYSGVPHNVYVF